MQASGQVVGATVEVEKKGQHSLDRSLVHGLAWLGGMKWAGQGLTWFTTILVARILSPADYGLVAIAASCLAIVTMLSDFGIDLVVMNFRDLQRSQLEQLNSLGLFAGVMAYVLLSVAALPISWFFHKPELVWVVAVMAVNFIAYGFKAVPYALLQKDMRFKFLAIVDAIQVLVQAATVVCLAVMGYGYWALVGSSVVGPMMTAAIVLITARQPYAWPQLNNLKPLLSYSRDVVLARILWVLNVNSDTFVVGRVLGTAALGAYSLGLSIANVVVEKVYGVINQVTASLFGAVQNDHTALRRYILVLTEGFAFVAFPVTIGLTLVANELIPVAFGDKWAPMIVPLQLLSLTAAYRSVAPLYAQVLFAVKDSGYAMRNQVLAAVVLPLGFAVGSLWGLTGVALVWVIIQPPISYRLACRAFALIGLSHKEYMRAFIPAVTATGAMVAAVMLVEMIRPTSWPPLVGLLGKVGVGAVVYLTIGLLVHRERIREFVALVRQSV